MTEIIASSMSMQAILYYVSYIDSDKQQYFEKPTPEELNKKIIKLEVKGPNNYYESFSLKKRHLYDAKNYIGRPIPIRGTRSAVKVVYPLINASGSSVPSGQYTLTLKSCVFRCLLPPNNKNVKFTNEKYDFIQWPGAIVYDANDQRVIVDWKFTDYPSQRNTIFSRDLVVILA